MISDESRNIGLRIREERIKRGITQEQLAKSIGYTGVKILRLERGYSNITDELVESAARALGVATAVLYSAPSKRAVSYLSVKTVRGIGRPRKERA